MKNEVQFMSQMSLSDLQYRIEKIKINKKGDAKQRQGELWNNSGQKRLPEKGRCGSKVINQGVFSMCVMFFHNRLGSIE